MKTKFILLLVVIGGVLPYVAQNPSYFLKMQEESVLGVTHPKWLDRWENFTLKRVDEQGRYPEMPKYYNAFKEHVYVQGAQNYKVQSLQWIPYGPFSLPEYPNPPYNEGMGRINCVAFHPNDTNVFFIGASQGGVWKTTNNGNSWMPITEKLPILRISDIAIDPTYPDTMYICLGDYAYIGVALDLDNRKRNTHYGMGVYRTFDGGLSWEPTGLSFENTDFDGSLMRRVLVNHTNSSELLAVGTSGIWKSFDNGDHWIQIMDSIMWDIEQSAQNPNVLYASSGYIENLDEGHASIFKSTDFGNTWMELSTGIPPQGLQRVELALSPTDTNYIYAITCDFNSGFAGLYKSSNAGQTWTLQSTSPNILNHSNDATGTGGQGTYDLSIVVDHTNPERIYIGGVNLWGSHDGGITWEGVSYWLNYYGETVHADQHQLKWHPLTEQYYLCNDGGIYRTNQIETDAWDSGNDWPTQWENLSNGMNITSFYRVSVSKSNSDIVLAGAQDNATFYFDGTFWRNLFGGDGMDCAIDPIDPNILYGSAQYGSFYLSHNGGQTVDYMYGGNGEWTTPIQIDPTNNNTLYLAMDQLYVSTNGGLSWDVISSFPTVGALGHALEATALRVSSLNSNFVYVAKRMYHNLNEDVQMWVTANGGLNWNNITTGLPSYHYITSIEIDENDASHVWVSLAGFTEGEKIYESLDAGQTWNNISSNLPNIPINSIIQQKGAELGVLFLGTDLGVWYKDENSSDWAVLGEGMPNVIVDDIEYHEQDKVLYAATFGRGIWKLDLGDFTTNEEYTNTTTPNYNISPNPNQGRFTVKNVVDKDANYEIIDVKGRVVYKGKVKNSFDVSLPSGVYWLNIKKENHSVYIEKFIIKD